MQKEHPLEKIKWGVIPCISYRGCWVYKNIVTDTYEMWGYVGLTADDVDRKINESLLSLMKSAYNENREG